MRKRSASDGAQQNVGGSATPRAHRGAQKKTESGMLELPGLIDCHVHFREPGFTHKATMASEARAARFGGVTTVCEMPNTVPPTVTIAALADKVQRAAAIEDCDIRFFFGITERSHIEELQSLWERPEHAALRARCSGVKLYLDHSTGNQKIADELLDEAFAACARLGIVTVCHCEDPEVNARAAASITRTDIASHALRRPPESEVASIERAIGLARRHGTHLHIAHLSTEGGVTLVRDAKRVGLPVTCEVAPHHLFLTVDDFTTLGTLAKMNPPLRTTEHRDALWAGIADGTVDCLATDHAPHTRDEKEKEAAEPLKAPSGVPGVATMLPLLLSVAAESWPHPSAPPPLHLRLTHDDIIRLCFENPNRIFALGKERTHETVTVDPAAEWIIRGSELPSLCGWTPFEGWRVTGRVVRVG